MQKHGIESKEELYHYLGVALQLEHATIPPYLMALYTIKPGTNGAATLIIRQVVVEEMLHLTLAANVLNALGGKPDLTGPDFVPCYPAPLPSGETDFEVSLRPFSHEAVDTFIKIERPALPPTTASSATATLSNATGAMMVKRTRRLALAFNHPANSDWTYYSIGEFYKAIQDGLRHLSEKMSAKELFNGDAKLQVGPEVYYSGGGNVTKVADLDSALRALGLIIGQGEGYTEKPFNEAGELAHEYRFEQLLLGKFYQVGDQAHKPTGEALQVDWTAAYPVKVDAKVRDYEKSPELYAAAVRFNAAYAEFLRLITQAFQGEPAVLIEKAVPWMFSIRNKISQLIHNPIPGMTGVNAAPTFEMAHTEVPVGGKA
jgi:hypothetical protein